MKILTIFFGLGALALLYFPIKEYNQGALWGGPCTNGKRYGPETQTRGGGAPISYFNGQNSANDFKHRKDMAATTSPDLKFRNGYFISKVALDQMFTQQQASSGLYCNLIIDSMDSVNIVFSTSHKAFTILEKSNDPDDVYFISNSFCPDFCGDIYNKTKD